LEEAIASRRPRAVNVLLFDPKADSRLTINFPEILSMGVSEFRYCTTLLHLASLGPREMNRVWECEIEEKEARQKKFNQGNLARPNDAIAASHSASLEIVQSFVKILDVNARDRNGKTRLDLAMEVSGRQGINPEFKVEYGKIVKFLESQKVKKLTCFHMIVASNPL
jgi:hypothetical protein